MTYCTDIDLLHWEPTLFAEAGFAAQTLFTGEATLAGTALTIASGSFTDAQVQAGQVALLTAGAFVGAFPIATVDSATQLTISTFYDRYEQEPVSPAAPSSVTVSVRTFWPQREVISRMIDEAAGLDAAAGQTILPGDGVRRACVLGSLRMIFNILDAASENTPQWGYRAGLYMNLYRRALRAATVQIDTNGDGVADVRRKLSLLELVRA
ncbi:MAG: hypothetical protein ACFCVE_01980 [Phycisphaerae bacterium]